MGFLSNAIKLKSGIRQGCPMSRDAFNIAINPLIVFLESCVNIVKYCTLSNMKILSLSYVDDLNLFLNSLSSLFNALNFIGKYKDVSDKSV